MASESFEKLKVYQAAAEELADLIWDVVSGWDEFARDTVGKQLVRAADSVGANIAEGQGRQSFADNKRFIRIARGSLNETRHFSAGPTNESSFPKRRPMLCKKSSVACPRCSMPTFVPSAPSTRPPRTNDQ
jgi:hypothetical protein